MEIKFFKDGKIVKKKRRLFFYCKVKAMSHNSKSLKISFLRR